MALPRNHAILFRLYLNSSSWLAGRSDAEEVRQGRVRDVHCILILIHHIVAMRTHHKYTHTHVRGKGNMKAMAGCCAYSGHHTTLEHVTEEHT